MRRPQRSADMLARNEQTDPSADLLLFAGKRRFATILADPPWQFTNRTGKMAPEHRRLSRYSKVLIDVVGIEQRRGPEGAEQILGDGFDERLRAASLGQVFEKWGAGLPPLAEDLCHRVGE